MAGTTTNGLPYPESTDFVTDGAQAIEDLAVDVDAKMGLWLVKTHTFTGTPTDTTVTNAFTSDYDDYRIILSGFVTSASASLNFQFVNSGGTTISTNYAMAGYYQVSSGTLTGDYTTTNGSMEIAKTVANQASSQSFDVLNPNLARYSSFPVIMSFASNVAINRTGYHSIATAYPSFKISVSTGTMSAGTIRVYGYRK